MISHCIRAVVLAAIVTTLSLAAPAHAAPFDGDWSVVVHTTNGHCGTTRWGLAIRGGHVYYAGGSTYGDQANLSGRVSSSGHLRVNIVTGPRSAQSAGRLVKSQGSGKWAGEGPSGTCSGVWTASRR
jgi:hypothetical protein